MWIGIAFGFFIGYITASNNFKKKYQIKEFDDIDVDGFRGAAIKRPEKKKESMFKKVFW